MSESGLVRGVALTGVPSREELEGSPGFTPEDWLRLGPKAVIECVQEIPCNPCERVCPNGAISVGEPITRLPRIDPSRCTGCGACIPACPGQAIFVVDMSRADYGVVSFPWEYLPEPRPGDMVMACDREGRAVCEATVVRVACPPRYDRTRVVTLAVPHEFCGRVRSMVRAGSGVAHARAAGAGDLSRRAAAAAGCAPRWCAAGNPDAGGGAACGDKVVVCRCEEVTLGEIRRAIADGATTFGAVRRWTRAGMGLCQGRTCRRLVVQEIERAIGAKPGAVPRETARPPVAPVPLAVLAAEGSQGKRGRLDDHLDPC